MASRPSVLHRASLLRYLTLTLITGVHSLPNSLLTPRQSTPSYTHTGCFLDGENGRALRGPSTASSSLTIESCAEFCLTQHSSKLFGVEYGVECFCGDAHTATPAPTTDCSFPCGGDHSQRCGAGNRLNIYLNNDYVPPAPATVPGATYLGCFVDSGPRILPIGATPQTGDDMTAETCAASCAALDPDNIYFGVEYGRECWCGTAAPGTGAVAPESECSFLCGGDATQLCGAGNRINVWGFDGPVPGPVGDYEYQGCWSDRGEARTLTGKVVYDSLLTLEKCAEECAAYEWFGVEYASQCYCGTGLDEGVVKRPGRECGMECGGDSEELCGDALRLNVYRRPGGEGPGNPETVGDFAYQSCWTDDVGARSLTGDEYRSDDMTLESCATFCEEFQYFGVEYSRECYCGNEIGGQEAPESDCGELCMGDSTEFCGAGNRLNVYSKTVGGGESAPVSSSVTPSTTSTAVTSSTSTSFSIIPSPE